MRRPIYNAFGRIGGWNWAKDSGCYTIEQALRKERGNDEANAEMLKLLAYHLHKRRTPDQPT
jgi:hypothetical protein